MIVCEYSAMTDEITPIYIMKMGLSIHPFLKDSIYRVIWKSELHLPISDFQTVIREPGLELADQPLTHRRVLPSSNKIPNHTT